MKERQKFKFGSLNIHHKKMLFEAVYKDWFNSVYRGIQNNSNILQYTGRIYFQFIFTFLECIKCNEMNLHLYILKKFPT